MKKFITLTISILFLIFLTSCGKETFTGNESATDTAYNLRFSELQGKKIHTMRFSEDDKVQVVIDKIKGSLNLSIEDEKGNNIYKGTSIEGSSFVLGIPKSGTYTIEVKGKKAVGSIDIEILKPESEKKISITEKMKDLDSSLPFEINKSCHNIFVGSIGSTNTIMDIWMSETSKDVIFSIYKDGKEEKYNGTFLSDNIVGFDSEDARFAFVKTAEDGLIGTYSTNGIKYENSTFALNHINYTYDKDRLYSYGENIDVENFATKITELITAKDLNGLSKIINYPITLNLETPITIKDTESFLNLDPSLIFTDKLISSIENGPKKYFFSNYQGIMLGLPDYNIWFIQTDNDSFEIIAINM